MFSSEEEHLFRKHVFANVIIFYANSYKQKKIMRKTCFCCCQHFLFDDYQNFYADRKKREQIADLINIS